ncbi:hypothetical protein OAH77_04465 [Flavobacteriaceae bacterium]|nr:hypothetical protein [Flavobacteriaceae bacterium]
MHSNYVVGKSSSDSKYDIFAYWNEDKEEWVNDRDDASTHDLEQAEAIIEVLGVDRLFVI